MARQPGDPREAKAVTGIRLWLLGRKGSHGDFVHWRRVAHSGGQRAAATQPDAANAAMIEHADVGSSFVRNRTGDRERQSNIGPAEETNTHST